MKAKQAIWALVIATVLFLCVASTGRCAKQKPGDVLCKAEMNAGTIKKYQDLLERFGHTLVVIEGTVYATVKEAKQHTFVAVLKCRDNKGNIYVVGVEYFKDDFQKVRIKPLGEKWTEM